MKRLVLLLVVAAFAASPAVAASKHKKSEQTAEAKQAAEAEDIAKQHDNTRRALRDALPLVLPSWSLPFFFGTHMDEKMKNETNNETKNEKKKEVHRRHSSSSAASNR
jgi:hypothetical protein